MGTRGTFVDVDTFRAIWFHSSSTRYAFVWSDWVLASLIAATWIGATLVYISTWASITSETCFTFAWVWSYYIYTGCINVTFVSGRTLIYIFACESTNSVFAIKPWFAIMRFSRTLVNIRAGSSITSITRITFTGITSDSICACGVLKNNFWLLL